MRWLCKFGIHLWEGKCLCSICHKRRNKNHLWENDGCVCSRCSTTRNKGHNWDGCVCTACGRRRNREHNWNGCICTLCQAKRDNGHIWKDCVCIACWKEIHNWQVSGRQYIGRKTEVIGPTNVDHREWEEYDLYEIITTCTKCGTTRSKFEAGECIRQW